MINLWYNSDEVTGFHPVVEKAINDAITNCGYDSVLELEHHPTIPNSTIIPDFAVKLKSSNRYVFVIEVKKTARDVSSQRYQNQTRSYISDYSPYWEPGYSQYFCLTNIEELILFAERPGPVSSCILKHNPKSHARFNSQTKDATLSLQGFQSSIEGILPLIVNRTQPAWDNNWEAIISHFNSNYRAISTGLNYSDELNKGLTLFELFRLLSYSYLKDYYTQTTNSNVSYFRSFPSDSLNLDQFKQSLTNNFDRILALDFKQLFSNHPIDNQRIFPEKFDSNIHSSFKSLIQCLNSYGNDAVKDNHSPSYIFDLLTSEIYEREEMHKKGKVMSDTELSLLLATLTIDNSNSKVIDPCCGDGALLDGAYDRINYLALSNNTILDHTSILTQLDGIEIDPFLSQMSGFRLLSKNLSQVTSSTEANIDQGDSFSKLRQTAYDALLMNPPFLRNDNPDTPITSQDKTRMNSAITSSGIPNFVQNAKQPNLYFYFLNYTWHYIKPEGKGGIILMTKFLNNKDGECIKQFILDKAEAVVSYPRKYFTGFDVTTVIVILKNGSNSENVSFLKIIDENLLSNPEGVLDVLALPTGTVTPSYKLKLVPRTELNPIENWRKYLLDEQYEKFNTLDFLVNIEHHFGDLKRGNAENNGGKKAIYLNEENNGDFIAHFEPDKRTSIRYVLPTSLNNLMGKGISNNFTRRSLILTDRDMEVEQAFQFPQKADKTQNNGLAQSLKTNQDLDIFYQAGTNAFGLDKWCQIVNNAFNHTRLNKITIPRSDRTKHVVYYNPSADELTLSTNFVSCNGLKNENPNISVESQYKFIASFLMSSFGQIQCEMEANNQEGMRKLEAMHMKRLLIPDLSQLNSTEINNVINEFDNLNALDISVSGDEGIQSNPRRDLDKAIANIVFQRDNLGFSNQDEMVNFIELFLADLVMDRRL